MAADECELRFALRIAPDTEVGVKAEKAGIGPEVEEAGERIVFFRFLREGDLESVAAGCCPSSEHLAQLGA